ncbi:hypothetical protein O3Q52_43200 [Streptomyces sp. ActVer]|nr:hypothetical protein [Streptomyces sp. ActVer]MCZ4514815.1 hypothetical protein [Streptomyces sp. ActVer]
MPQEPTKSVPRTLLARIKLTSRVPFVFHGSWADHLTLDRAIAAHCDDDR